MSKSPRGGSRASDDAPPESDRFGEFPHPRATHTLFGHQAAEQKLLTAFRNGRLAPSWIIGGREGVGKATLAWRFARFLLAHPDPADPQTQAATDLAVEHGHPVARRVEAMSRDDLILVRREWNTKEKRHYTEIRVDDVRALIHRFQRTGSTSGWRVAIIDCADDLNPSSANALLKLIEEPPPRSLFLFVAHRPAQVLPTIRSRSRMLPLSPLSGPDVELAVRAALTATDTPAEEVDRDAPALAARSGGSVREALRLHATTAGAFARFEEIMDGLADPDWLAIHDLVDALAERTQQAEFDAMLALVCDWMDQRVRDLAQERDARPERLARFADVWEKIATSARQVEAYNLDRRPFLFAMFSDLTELAAPPAH